MWSWHRGNGVGWGSSWHGRGTFIPKKYLSWRTLKQLLQLLGRLRSQHLKKVVDEIKRVEGGGVVRLGWVKAHMGISGMRLQMSENGSDCPPKHVESLSWPECGMRK